MNIRMPSSRRRLSIAVVLVVVVVGAVVSANLAMGNSAAAPDPSDGPVPTLAPMVSTSSTTDWPRNADGLTYGSEADTESLSDYPDLIAVVATNGESGYVRRADVQLSPPTAEQVKAAASKIWSIPVYEMDGKTQVGVFKTGWAPASDGVVPAE